MNNKFGKYIGELMLLVIEQGRDTTMHKLAIQELKKLADDIYDFVKAQTIEKETKPEKQLLQEDSNESN